MQNKDKIMRINPLTPKSDWDLILITASLLHQMLKSWEYGKWLQTKEAHDFQTNSPCQYNKKSKEQYGEYTYWCKDVKGQRST